jgi:hypothetical protein
MEEFLGKDSKPVLSLPPSQGAWELLNGIEEDLAFGADFLDIFGSKPTGDGFETTLEKPLSAIEPLSAESLLPDLSFELGKPVGSFDRTAFSPGVGVDKSSADTDFLPEDHGILSKKRAIVEDELAPLDISDFWFDPDASVFNWGEDEQSQQLDVVLLSALSVTHELKTPLKPVSKRVDGSEGSESKPKKAKVE